MIYKGKPVNAKMPMQQLRLHFGEITYNESLVARAAIDFANAQFVYIDEFSELTPQEWDRLKDLMGVKTMQTNSEKQYDEYFDTEERANRKPLTYDAWLARNEASAAKPQARLHGVDLHSVIDSHDVILRFNDNWNIGIKLVDGMSKPRLLQALQHAIDTIAASENPPLSADILQWQYPTKFSCETVDGLYYIEKAVSGTYWNIYKRRDSLGKAVSLDIAKKICQNNFLVEKDNANGNQA